LPEAEKSAAETSPGGVRRRCSANVAGDPRLERAMRFFDQRFAEHVTIQAAARVAGLSSDHFGEVFRAALGCTPHQYLVGCRLRHARQLIASEGHRRSLAEIAWAAGFADQAHLTRHFQRAFGQSPGQWREQIWCKTGFNFPGFVQDARLTVRPD
jgi:transcriptional regulator GlxA family with amidase domain